MGRNKGKDKPQAYFHFLTQVIRCVRKHGKQVMMWGDILLEHPELLESLPKDVIVLNWEYSAHPSEEKVIAISQLGQPQILCPGTSTWNYVVPKMAECVPNIVAMAQYAKRHGALGILNTNWGDFCNIGSLTFALYPMTIGAAVLWNPDTVIDEAFEKSVSLQLYDDSTGKSIALLKRMSSCERNGLWGALCWWKVQKQPFSYTEQELSEQVAVCGQLMLEWKELAKQNIHSTLLKEALLACRTIALFCALLRKMLRTDTPLPEDPENWIRDFSDVWMTDNKTSELPQVVEFLRALIRR